MKNIFFKQLVRIDRKSCVQFRHHFLIGNLTGFPKKPLAFFFFGTLEKYFVLHGLYAVYQKLCTITAVYIVQNAIIIIECNYLYIAYHSNWSTNNYDSILVRVRNFSSFWLLLNSCYDVVFSSLFLGKNLNKKRRYAGTKVKLFLFTYTQNVCASPYANKYILYVEKKSITKLCLLKSPNRSTTDFTSNRDNRKQ